MEAPGDGLLFSPTRGPRGPVGLNGGQFQVILDFLNKFLVPDTFI